MAPLIARETPEGGVRRATNSACKLEDLSGATQQRLGLVGLRQRDHRAVAEVDVDALALSRQAPAEEQRPRDGAGAEQHAGQDVTASHRSFSLVLGACASPELASWARPGFRARAGSSSGRRRRAQPSAPAALSPRSGARRPE